MFFRSKFEPCRVNLYSSTDTCITTQLVDLWFFLVFRELSFYILYFTRRIICKIFTILCRQIDPHVHLCKVWVAKVRARTHTCDVCSHMCMCVRNPFWKVSGMCVCAALFWACDVRLHFCTLLHIFWGQNCQKMLHFRTSFPALERPFLFWIILFCFRMSYSVLEHTKPKKCWKIAEKSLKN